MCGGEWPAPLRDRRGPRDPPVDRAGRPAPAPLAAARARADRDAEGGSAPHGPLWERPLQRARHHIGRRVELAVLGGELVISCAGSEIARHRVAGPGELSLDDAHYDRPAQAPVRAIHPRSAAELAFCNLGPVADAFLRAAAASGTSRLAHELTDIVELGAAYGHDALIAALERALAFRRFRAADVRAILAAGAATPAVRPPGAPLAIELPAVPTRPLAAYAVEADR